MRADLVGFADVLLSAGCLAAGLGALVGSAWLAGAGVVAVLAAGAFGWVVTLAEERRMRGTTSDRAGIGHRGARHTVAAQVTAREAGTP